MRCLSRRDLQRFLQGTDPQKDQLVIDSKGVVAAYHAAGCSMFDSQVARPASYNAARGLVADEEDGSRLGSSILNGPNTELRDGSDDIMVEEVLRLQEELGYAAALEQKPYFHPNAVAETLGFQVRQVKTILKRS